MEKEQIRTLVWRALEQSIENGYDDEVMNSPAEDVALDLTMYERGVEELTFDQDGEEIPGRMELVEGAVLGFRAFLRCRG